MVKKSVAILMVLICSTTTAAKNERVREVQLKPQESLKTSFSLDIPSVTHLLFWEVVNQKTSGQTVKYTIYKYTTQESRTKVHDQTLQPGKSVSDYRFLEQSGTFSPGLYEMELSCDHPYSCSAEGFIEREPID